MNTVVPRISRYFFVFAVCVLVSCTLILKMYYHSNVYFLSYSMVVTEESVVEYVIYCRKSTDESSGMQVQSIPDQINACVKYAQDHGLTIKKKPQNFSDFETEYDVLKEDQDLDNQSIYQDTKDYFIIKEQESAKTP